MVIHKRKRASVALSAALVVSMLATGGTIAAQGQTGAALVQSAPHQYKSVTIIIDGKVRKFPQSAVVKDGSTLVPLRGIFEALGAKVLWEEATRSVTATKGDTTIVLTVNESLAYVNGESVMLTAKAEIINGSTMVPLRFVSEALGSEVKWDASTFTALITSGTVQAPVNGGSQTVGSIKVQYGKHDYGSTNQSQYDQVMKIVNKAVEKVEDVKFGGGNGELEQYYEAYFKGERFNGNYADKSVKNRNLRSVHSAIGALADAGVSKDAIIKAYKTGQIGGQLIQGKKDPGTGSPYSAYQTLIEGIIDCDSEAQVYSAVFDAMGFSTAVVGGSGHGEVIVKIDGHWFTYAAGGFLKVDTSGYSIWVSQPTF